MALWGLFINGTLILSSWVLSQDPTISLGPHLLIPFIILRIRFQTTSLRRKDTIRPSIAQPFVVPAILGLTPSQFISLVDWISVSPITGKGGEKWEGTPHVCSSPDFPRVSLFCCSVPCTVPGASSSCVFPPSVGGCVVTTLSTLGAHKIWLPPSP